ncbi:MAG: DNA-processing protein DprA [Ruminococcus sp.]|jgi:DNA processing protein|nr:DNA-processing protein DprA [Ruminococcus sp.]
MNSSEKWFRLSLMFPPGSRNLWNLYKLWGEDLDRLYLEVTENLNNFRSALTPSEVSGIENFSEDGFYKLCDKCQKDGIFTVCYDSEYYPERLREISNPPALLYGYGDSSVLNYENQLAVVGARKASDYSLKITEKLVNAIQSGVRTDIISGFAKGTDITSHLAAVEHGAKTIAVLGCGLNIEYPAANQRYKKLIAENGCLISKYPPETPPLSHYFPIRNRIISGMAKAVLVVEASEKSGSLITANLSCDYGRDVFVIPPSNLFSESYRGNVKLLRDGAIPVYGAFEILAEFLDFTDFRIQNTEHRSQNTEIRGQKSEVRIAEPELLDDPEKRVEINAVIEALSDTEKIVFDEIAGASDGINADDIIANLDLDTLDVLDILTDLEISGVIKKTINNTYLKC